MLEGLDDGAGRCPPPLVLFPSAGRSLETTGDGGTLRPRPACGSLPSAGSGDSCVALLGLAPCPKTAVSINKQC